MWHVNALEPVEAAAAGYCLSSGPVRLIETSIDISIYTAVSSEPSILIGHVAF